MKKLINCLLDGLEAVFARFGQAEEPELDNCMPRVDSAPLHGKGDWAKPTALSPTDMSFKDLLHGAPASMAKTCIVFVRNVGCVWGAATDEGDSSPEALTAYHQAGYGNKVR